MINKYCYKCGSEIWARAKWCENCKAPVIEMPVSNVQKEQIEKIKEIQAQNPTSKGKGCFAVMVVGFIMFGIPMIVIQSDIGYDSIITKLLMILIFLGMNILLSKYRKNLGYKKKKFFNLTKKNKVYFENIEILCTNCRQKLTKEMVYCPKCSKTTNEDIAIDLSQYKDDYKQNIKTTTEELEPKKITKEYKVKCVNCGADIGRGKFCTECGTKVEVK
ncbi:hypothetical protein [Crassaminicella profunda]|uniref:hypothetical protein n=1 Tax=Crassaminicella profunda TaxID=1286698 RepID=UPI001CA6F4FA|nr:hypothetical protein [Crassaminicella profunda]QZY54530.1 hypothetical protein K7H06_16020 [Crassaminicella profunda]